MANDLALPTLVLSGRAGKAFRWDRSVAVASHTKMGIYYPRRPEDSRLPCSSEDGGWGGATSWCYADKGLGCKP